jgi:hypothetical protein
VGGDHDQAGEPHARSAPSGWTAAASAEIGAEGIPTLPRSYPRRRLP